MFLALPITRSTIESFIETVLSFQRRCDLEILFSQTDIKMKKPKAIIITDNVKLELVCGFILDNSIAKEMGILPVRCTPDTIFFFFFFFFKITKTGLKV